MVKNIHNKLKIKFHKNKKENILVKTIQCITNQFLILCHLKNRMSGETIKKTNL